MPRSTLSIVLALALLIGFTTTAQADVTGSFDLEISLTPEGTQTEAVKFFFDMQSNLQVNVTLSGLTFGADIGFGITGVEFAILTLTTNLGALAIHDDFVFAEPFGCTAFAANGDTYPGAGMLSNTHGGGNATTVYGQCKAIYTVPIGDGNGDGVFDNAVGFVKKRVEMELNIAGITLTNLALFEDVDFPDIQGQISKDFDPFLTDSQNSDHEHDHSFGDRLYNIAQINSVVDDQTPTFGFGDVVTISGQTVSGITVSGTTGFCADQKNRIKKRSWPYEVNEACTAALGGAIVQPGIEGGAKTPVLFEFETLSIEGVEFGGITVDVFTKWKPYYPDGFFTLFTVSFSVLDLADVQVELYSDNITNLYADYIITTVTTGNLTVVLYDCYDIGAGCALGFGADLTIDRVEAIMSVVLNPNQNPADLVLDITVDRNTGLTKAVASLGISRGVLSLDTTTTFKGTSGLLAWNKTTFSLGVDGGAGLSVNAEFAYTPKGMGASSISLGVTF